MSANGDDQPRLREVACRLFATEFDDADFSYSESDEERAPNYVVTPTGARVNRLFAVGVLTEVESVNQEVLRARVADSTGAFVVYAGQYQPEALGFLESAEPPLFVAVTGKARTFEPDDSDRVYTSIRPESISEVDAETRDRWVVQAAEQTVERVGLLASAKQTGLAGGQLRTALENSGYTEAQAAGVTLALDHYGTTGEYLQALRETALDAARVVTGERDEARGVSMRPDDGTDDPIPLLADVEVSVPDGEADLEPEPAAPTADGSESVTVSTSDAEALESSAEPASSPEEPTSAESTASDRAEAADTGPVEATGTETTTTDERASAETPTADSEHDAEPGEPAATASESATEPASAGGADESVETAARSPGTETGDDSAPESATGTDDAGTANETDTGVAGESTTGDEPATDDDLGDFEPEFELDEDEREQIESEFGTEFQSGTDVDDPGEADIETPSAEEVERAAESAEDSTVATDESATPESGGEDVPADDPATDDAPADAAGSETVDADDVDLEDAVMEAMSDLDDGSGADREDLVAAVADRHGADPAAVEAAIQDALMGGRCYEPEDGKLTPI
ncbi:MULTISPECIES: hypothetical protein [Haloarcula]|uniref:hypothetical protein n=1 Tax=Haloarcula TaxID=2237 RepID=UPI0023EB71B2|nr:hypothetical protein [Halomicroarcula sp. XH51]